MSCEESPALALDLRTDWTVVWTLAAWAGGLLTCLWQADLPHGLLAFASMVVPLVVAPALDSQLFGISPRAPVRVTRNSQGEWQVAFADGKQCPAALCRPSRPLPGGAMLVLRSARGRHWMVLRAGPTNGAELRHLRVLMRLAP